MPECCNGKKLRLCPFWSPVAANMIVNKDRRGCDQVSCDHWLYSDKASTEPLVCVEVELRVKEKVRR